jgi:hypothetical protein
MLQDKYFKFSQNKSEMSCARLYQLSDPRGGTNIDPRGMMNDSFVDVKKAMLHVKYLSSRHGSFTK